jgi:hypothetical protein
MAVQYHASISPVPRASSDQIDMATEMIKKLHLKNFSVADYPDPGTTKLFCRYGSFPKTVTLWDSGIHDGITSHKSQSLTVLGKPP